MDEQTLNKCCRVLTNVRIPQHIKDSVADSSAMKPLMGMLDNCDTLQKDTGHYAVGSVDYVIPFGLNNIEFYKRYRGIGEDFTKANVVQLIQKSVDWHIDVPKPYDIYALVLRGQGVACARINEATAFLNVKEGDLFCLPIDVEHCFSCTEDVVLVCAMKYRSLELYYEFNKVRF